MVSKVTYTDITNRQTNGESGAALVNDLKRAVNEVIDLVGGIDLGGVGGSTLPVLQPRQLGDGIKSTFRTPATGTQDAKAQYFEVYLNYVYQRPELDFTIDGATGDLTFIDNSSPYTPNLNDTVDIKYVKPYTFETSSDTPVEGTGTGITKSIGDWCGDVQNIEDQRLPRVSRGGDFMTYGGTANAITLTSANTEALGTVQDGDKLRFKATATNTGSATITIDGGTVLTCKTPTGVNLPAGFIRTDVFTEGEVDGANFVVAPPLVSDQPIISTNKFGGGSINADIGRGIANSTTNALFYLPIDRIVKPTGITVSGSFSVLNANSIIASGITAVSFGSTSSNKLCVLSISLTGATVGEALTLRAETAGSFITVDF